MVDVVTFGLHGAQRHARPCCGLSPTVEGFELYPRLPEPDDDVRAAAAAYHDAKAAALMQRVDRLIAVTTWRSVNGPAAASSGCTRKIMRPRWASNCSTDSSSPPGRMRTMTRILHLAMQDLQLADIQSFETSPLPCSSSADAGPSTAGARARRLRHDFTKRLSSQ